jgi:hypothetical protein
MGITFSGGGSGGRTALTKILDWAPQAVIKPKEIRQRNANLLRSVEIAAFTTESSYGNVEAAHWELISQTDEFPWIPNTHYFMSEIALFSGRRAVRISAGVSRGTADAMELFGWEFLDSDSAFRTDVPDSSARLALADLALPSRNVRETDTGTLRTQLANPSSVPANWVILAADTIPRQTLVTVSAGQPMHTNVAGQLVLARANSSSLAKVSGLSTDNVAANAGAPLERNALSLIDWTAATDSSVLIPGATYFLSEAATGKLTTVAPTAAGMYVVRIGVAISFNVLALSIGEPYLLT